jgi:hypothetical protein
LMGIVMIAQECSGSWEDRGVKKESGKHQAQECHRCFRCDLS